MTFCLALVEWNFEEAGVGTGAKRSRRVQMQVREISRGRGGDGVESLLVSWCFKPSQPDGVETEACKQDIRALTRNQ